ncbi:unnamed protein product [Linum trigynum]|uniref:Protein kinase domain-containing protein n=1 Tax=Linum trigynum TaxID=586398 RepID=A0AAV2CR21_9ROSI
MVTAALLLSCFPFLFSSLVIAILPQTSPNLKTCNSSSSCETFAILHTNPFFSSLSNLTLFLNLNRVAIAEANELPPKTEYFKKDQSLLIPLTCKCSKGGFEAELVKTTVKGDSFSSIAGSLEGLTNIDGIRTRNPNVGPWNLGEKARILIPLRCGCPEAPLDKARIFLTYPVLPGDSISTLSIKFNASPESIVSANPQLQAKLQPFTSVLIPVTEKPHILFPNFRLRRKKMRRKVGMYVAVICGVILGCIAIAAGVFVALMQLKKREAQKQGNQLGKKQRSKDADVELQQLSLSVRTTSDKKVSFESSQHENVDLNHPHSQIVEATTPRQKRTILESYTVEEIQRATEDFDSGNHIQGSVYHGRLNGKNMAIKRLKSEHVSKIEFGILSNPTHHHPKILKVLGTCLSEEGSNCSYLVFEYAKNGSLKDWLHGGLAMKNQFIASCYCFLTWDQRLKICLDVAVGLQYMHHIMSPSYVHMKLRSRNIFLDEEFTAKIGNFAMAKLVEEDDQIDIDYLAPEYVNQEVIAPSIDIFAYGVVLLEVLSGKTAMARGDEKGKGSVKLCESVKRVLDSENDVDLKEWIDGVLGDGYSLDEALTLANLARTCVDEDPSLRPSAGDIVEKLSALVEESSMGEGGESSNVLFSESSSKPLVKAAAT